MDIPFKVLNEGLYCTAGEFFIDAWGPVPLTLITHAHGDHARFGCGKYIAQEDSLEILKHRLGKDTEIQVIKYQQPIKLGNCWISFHPAGHILGSSQIRIETEGKVYVITGDYKRAHDATCQPFEVVECDVFMTESTFGLPIYQWEDSTLIGQQIYDWWQENSQNNHPSILFCYALGKAQRVLSLLKNYTDQPVYLHGAMYGLTEIYANKGIPLLPFLKIGDKEKSESFAKELILAPPSAAASPWLKRFPSFRTAFASGWMQVRGIRKRRAADRGFVLSDHADWNALIDTIRQTKAKQIITMHGYTSVLAKYVQEELYLQAEELKGLEAVTEEEDG